MDEHAQAMARKRWAQATDQDRADAADRARAMAKKRKRNTTPIQRSEAARKAARARWDRRPPPADEPG